ncbi:Uncaracterized surface protein containing fasciclin (FAS1) repeats [Asanoa hainanensis]|uniref:Uncaracterized surface protein containing fasciclin (FAS1) repeats n=1 Tax=Asanoa hainanensis TaxID=560556 RepID=A0A239LIZ4_9ACTN|nr:fasciclin domain-containing protein [Asanoa hainanensis]SNT29868.1 Uncaracterized surface protein containing fasciclin (FAS1) repeats [Asanoa hainanensis]
MRTRLLAVVVVAALALAGCTSDSSTTTAVSGPLCDELPKGDEPGNPTALASEPVDQALQWITVLTTFEGALRASELVPELEGKKAITVLAPSDDAFMAKFSQDNLDELMIKDKDTLRTLLRAHIVDRSLSLADLRDADSVTTLDGTTVKVGEADKMARIGDEATTVCADYRIANGRVHVINHVLGNLPTTAGQGDSGH